MRLVSPDLIANDNKFNIHYYDYIYCFLIYGLVHLIINIVLLRANHFPFVAIGPDDFSNLNYGSPFVPVRPISYFCVFVFSKTSELGFYLLLNALIVATSSMAYFTLARIANLNKNEFYISIILFSILMCSLDFMGEYTRLTGLIPNLLSMFFGYLVLFVIWSENKFKYIFSYLIVLGSLQTLGVLSKEDFFHIPIVWVLFFIACNLSKTTFFTIKKSAVVVFILSIFPVICILLQKNSSAFVQGFSQSGSELTPTFSIISVWNTFNYYHSAFIIVKFFEIFLLIFSALYLLFKFDKFIILMISMCLLCRFPYLLLPKHLLNHYFINWILPEVFLAIYLLLKSYKSLVSPLPTKIKAVIIIGFFMLLFFLVKTSSKHRSLSLNFYEPLARSHANLYFVCESNKGLINFSEVVAIVGDVQGFGLRSTPFDDYNSAHLNKKGISPAKWVRYIDSEKFPEAPALVDWFKSHNIPSNISIMPEKDSLALCKKNKWPVIYYDNNMISFIKN
jgi:hypothetical protein